MEDTGWYVANYSNAEELTWGFGRGCSFAQHSCYQYGLEKEPYCDSYGDRDHPYKTTRCTEPDRAAVGQCNLEHYGDDLPPEFQYFGRKNEKLGGSVALADFCPFVQDFNWRMRGKILRG